MSASPRAVLERIVIDGFGPFSHLTVTLGDGFHVLSGPNEAGKSTALAFVRGVLFGFAGRRGAPAPESPPGQPLGGELHFRRGGQLLIARRVARPKRLDGELVVLDEHRAPLPESALWEALGHVSEPLFRQVFAFTLDELNALALIEDDSQVAQALFAVGVQGARKLPDALATLERERDGLYGARARNRPLNQLLKELEGLRLELAQLDGQPERLAADVAARRALRLRLESLDAEVGQAQQALAAAEALARAEPHLRALQALSAAPPELAGPAAAEGGLRAALARARAEGTRAGAAALAAAERLEGAQADARLAHRRAEEALVALAHQQAAAPAPAQAQVRRLEAALARVQAYGPMAERLGARESALTERRRALGLALERLLPGRPVEALKGLDVGAAVRAGLSELAQARLDAQQRAGRAQALHQELSGRVAGLEGLAAGQPSATEAAAVAQQRAALSRLAALRAERAALLAVAEPPAGPPPQDWVKGAALLALVALVAIVLLAPPAIGAAAFFGALIAVGGGAAWWVGERRRRLAAQAAREAQAAAHGQSLAKVEERWRAALAVLGVASEEDVGAAAARLDAEEARLAREQARRDAAREELAAATARRAAAAAELAQAQAALDRLALAADERLAPLGVHGLEPAAGVDLCLELAQLQERWTLVEQEAAAHAHDAAAVAAGEEALRQACAEAGVEGAGPALALAAQRWLEGCRQASAARDALGARAAEVQGQRDGQAQRLAQVEDELTGLLSAAQVPTVGALRDAHARRDAALRWAEAVERELAAAEGAGQAPVEQLVASAAEQSLDARLGAAQRAYQRAHGQRTVALAELGALDERIAAAQVDDAAHRLRSEEERVVAAIRRAAREYAVASWARGLLDEARARFELEHQPRVVRQASEYFVELTARRYTRVAVNLTARRLTVHGARGETLGAEQLSRGTRELLVLALHLAVVRDFAERHVALPVLLDDVLVNLDPERAERVAALLGRLAQEHQVIVLTCHPWIREACAAQGARGALLNPPTQLSLLSPS